MLILQVLLLAIGAAAGTASISSASISAQSSVSEPKKSNNCTKVAHIDPNAPFTETPHFSFDQLYNLSTNFFDTFMFPNNAAEAAKINSTLFAENVKGRVDVTRNFDGRELNTEYAFGLFSEIAANPKSFTLLGIPQSYVLTHFTANQNIASMAVVIDFNITAIGIVNPVEVDFWVTYNSRGEISQYDASFRWLQWQFDALSQFAATKFKLANITAVQAMSATYLANSICQTAQDYCVGPNQQYEDKNKCLNFLTKEVRFGSAYELGMNTLLCRMIHQAMVAYRPGVHCMHIGPTGGGYCTDDRTYADNVRQKIFNNAPFVPYGKQAAGTKSQE